MQTERLVKFPERNSTNKKDNITCVTALSTKALNPETDSLRYCTLNCTAKSSLDGNALCETQQSASTGKEMGTRSWEWEEGVEEVGIEII